jgi:hypothetical protein
MGDHIKLGDWKCWRIAIGECGVLKGNPEYLKWIRKSL